jgi:prepilin-type N-terminal cleavage/methylation domain-containing protein
MFLVKKQKQKGFTLVELLVTISIFVILTGVVLFNQTRFNSTILLTNLAYDTALTIRQAQNYGINIKEFDSGSGNGGKFVPYGVHFDTSSDKSFILFADLNSDGIITEPTLNSCVALEGCVNRYSIKRGNYISDIEVVKGVSTSSPSILDITFERPNPDAKIYADKSIAVEYDSAIITLRGADETSVRRVRVQANGLIEILNN